MIANILYGSAGFTHGGLTFLARAAGKRGQAITIEIIKPGPLGVVVGPVVPVLGTGTITMTVDVATTEAQLRALLNSTAAFKKLGSVQQSSGDGTAVVLPLAPTVLDTPIGGLQQHFTTRTGIANWSDREAIVTGKPAGIIMLMEAQVDRQQPGLSVNALDQWTGLLFTRIAFQHDLDFETQNIILDLYRRAMYLCLRTFTHPELSGIGTIKFGYVNALKDEQTGEIYDHARLNIMATSEIKWAEPAVDPTDVDEFILTQLNIHLWREPVDDIPGPGGGEEMNLPDMQLTP